ncbi:MULTISPECIES: hypothetical protein [Thermomonospora]|uniref:Outer membrane channel protein CpnT-like N-terminal domain-containing protein n=1 Tax=Thermomonospora curvata (strain ATCC 19995 / DSM 43183 / JCM 3096 / KCTC 9072 / NBRC 15933 / NCIMB 10081 / Henssen B9) TaxID=471852 RepID=D1A5H1_THECD|nr:MULTISPECIES: hypothetical protein [Thermomonospora]ACY96331.1 hypothetical protein Tcur_0738 [Thermomonospora curvata DSM 43183]PKK15739.1 MAG: hypothetical protein BUE48_003560 [Thermomonospora sp. CIF 1]
MGLQLPGELISLLGMLGFTWPEADETKLFEMGQRWVSFSGTLESDISAADAAVQQVWSGHSGQGIEAFQNAWSGSDSASANLHTASEGAVLIGAGLFVMGAVVLALKINVIIQLTILAFQIAQAIATAPATFGASLLEIPIFKEITKMIIDFLIDQAIQVLLGG